MNAFILFLSLLGLVAAAPITLTTTTSSPSSAAPTGVYTYTNTAITVSGTSIVLPSATSIVVPTAFVFPPFSPLDAAHAHLNVDMQLASSATCAECGHVSVALPSASPSAGVSAENTHLGAPYPHPHALPVLPRLDGPGLVDGNYGVGVPGKPSPSTSVIALPLTHPLLAGHSDHHGESVVGAEHGCIGAPHCSHGHHSSSSTPTSAENTHLGAPQPILPRQDEPGSVDGNYGVGAPGHHASAASSSPSATSAENGHIGAPSHHGDDHGHGHIIGAEHGCVGCPGGEHAGGHGHV